ncbi:MULTISPECIES: hypothetical protein [Planktothrix]|nr:MULTISPECIES: hypothetical protein [Planktothrix]
MFKSPYVQKLNQEEVGDRSPTSSEQLNVDIHPAVNGRGFLTTPPF